MNGLIRILIVEDNPADMRLIKEAFKTLEGNCNYILTFTADGVEAMNYLYRTGKYVESPEPNIIFLDLNLPKKSGYEVLHEVKSNNQLSHIPIIILSSSEDFVRDAYSHYANSYLRKPVDYDEFIVMIKSVEDFWLKNAILPS